MTACHVVEAAAAPGSAPVRHRKARRMFPLFVAGREVVVVVEERHDEEQEHCNGMDHTHRPPRRIAPWEQGVAAAPSWAYPQNPCSSAVDLEEVEVLLLEHLVEEVGDETQELQEIVARARR